MSRKVDRDDSHYIVLRNGRDVIRVPRAEELEADNDFKDQDDRAQVWNRLQSAVRYLEHCLRYDRMAAVYYPEQVVNRRLCYGATLSLQLPRTGMSLADWRRELHSLISDVGFLTDFLGKSWSDSAYEPAVNRECRWRFTEYEAQKMADDYRSRNRRGMTEREQSEKRQVDEDLAYSESVREDHARGWPPKPGDNW